MPDIITEVTLPSQGKIYAKEIAWKNQLRAPRLKDRGLGDTTRVLQLQANILDHTLLTPLGISAYDLHTADFTYLNMRQRQLSKGNRPYPVNIAPCPKCGKVHSVNIDFNELEIKYLKEPLDLTYTTLAENVLGLTFLTPRIIDDSRANAKEYLEEYPDVEMTRGDLELQEMLKLVIKTVDGKKLSGPRLTAFVQDLYSADIDGIMAKLQEDNFGVQFRRTMTCTGCGTRISYNVPLG